MLGTLRTPGRGIVIEGPSGIGKTSAIETAIKKLDMAVTKLSARRPGDMEYIYALPEMGPSGIVIVDDFHKLTDAYKRRLADYMKTLADEESETTKLVIIGINMAGERLIALASDLLNRIDIFRFETNPEHKIRELIGKGEDALNVSINVADEVVAASQGSFYIAQMLCHEICISSQITESSNYARSTAVSFESVKSSVLQRLYLRFHERCRQFARGTKLYPEGRAPYLHILNWLATGSSWTLSLPEAMRAHTDLRGSVGQVVEKGYLADLISSNHECSEVMHYESGSKLLTVEDPQFVFYIRNLPWNNFAKEIGYRSIDFKNRYDFALSFAGEDRLIAKALFEELEKRQLEVFYDENEQYRIAGEDVEEYLHPIYKSEAKYVIPILSPSYPKKIWTKFESEAFKDRFISGEVIPIRFTSTQAGIFDTSARFGHLSYDPALPMDSQIAKIADLLVQKLSCLS